MKKIIIFLIFLLFLPVTSFANPLLTISGANGHVVTYLKTTSYYMLSVARIFNRPNGTTINCYGASEIITIMALPDDGYEFDYWTGTMPLEDKIDVFTMPLEGATIVAHYKKIEVPEPCPVCVDCPVIEPCPTCPDCVCPTPEPCPVCPTCPDCVCPVIEPCPEVIIPPCPVCPKDKEDEGLCFINSLK